MNSEVTAGSLAEPQVYAILLGLFAALALLVGTASLAAYLPARRASRIEPLAALRHE